MRARYTASTVAFSPPFTMASAECRVSNKKPPKSRRDG